ncbi:MAG TPA: hypothetical protein VHU61_15410 [Solirubrobacteraceae bacterium]|nr:hypothetical protein [Solirubrobacteraceae bacterium]
MFVASGINDAVAVDRESSVAEQHAELGIFSRPLRQNPNPTAVPAGSYAYSFNAGGSSRSRDYQLGAASHLGAGGVRHSGALRWSTSGRAE